MGVFLYRVIVGIKPIDFTLIIGIRNASPLQCYFEKGALHGANRFSSIFCLLTERIIQLLTSLTQHFHFSFCCIIFFYVIHTCAIIIHNRNQCLLFHRICFIFFKTLDIFRKLQFSTYRFFSLHSHHKLKCE